MEWGGVLLLEAGIVSTGIVLVERDAVIKADIIIGVKRSDVGGWSRFGRIF